MTPIRRRTAARALLSVFTIAVVLTGCGSGDTATLEHEVAVESVSAEAAFDVVDAGDHVVLDVRTFEEYAGGHVAGAENIDFYAADFADRIAALDRDQPYVLYCRSGNRSGATLDLMRDLGFTDVHEVAGGILDWEAAGLPLTGS